MIDPVVDHDWLRAHGDRVVLADVRWYLDGRSGRAAYESGAPGRLCSWIALAMRPLPVPVSPVMRMVTRPCAAMRTCRMTS